MGRPESNRSSQLRLLAVLLVMGSFALGATIAGAVLYVRHVFQTTLVNVARASGIHLVPGDINWGFGFVQLFNSRFTLLNVPNVAGTVGRIDIDLNGVTPTRILLANVDLVAKGDPLVLYRNLTTLGRQLEQLRANPESTDNPPRFTLETIGLRIESTHPMIADLDVRGIRFARNQGKLKDETTVSTTETRVGTTALGPLTVAFREPKEGGVQFAYGPSLEQAQWVLGYRELPSGPSFAASLESVDARELFTRLNQPVPEALSRAKIGGKLTIAINSESGRGVGQLSLRLLGFVPPHPPELQGYSFDDRTDIEATLESDPLLTTLTIPVLRLNNGKIRLLGNGRVERQAFVAKVVADLSTQLDCVTLARGFAKSEVGGALGEWGANNAKLAVRGQVSVRLQLEASSNDLGNAKVVKRIGVGCGLRPMTLENILALGLPPPPEPKAVENLTQKLLKGGGTLPPLPNLLPSFNEMLEAGFGNQPKSTSSGAAKN